MSDALRSRVRLTDVAPPDPARGRRRDRRPPPAGREGRRPARRDGARPGRGADQPRDPALARGLRPHRAAGLDAGAGLPRGAADPRLAAEGGAPSARDRARPTWRCPAPRQPTCWPASASSSRGRGSRQLVWLTEGWPAALYLAARAIANGEVTAKRPFSGTDRLMQRLPPGRGARPPAGGRAQTPGPYVDPGPGQRPAGRRASWVAASATRLLDRLRRRNLLVVTARQPGRVVPLPPPPPPGAAGRAPCRARRPGREPPRAGGDVVQANGDPRARDRPRLPGGRRRRCSAGWSSTAMQHVWASGHIDTVLQLDGAARPRARRLLTRRR